MRIEPLHFPTRNYYELQHQREKNNTGASKPIVQEISFKGIFADFFNFIKVLLQEYRDSGWDIRNYWERTDTNYTPLGDGGTEPYDPNPVPDYSSKLTQEDIERNVAEAVAKLHARQAAKKEQQARLVQEANASINAEIASKASIAGQVSAINNDFLELYNHFIELRKKTGMPISAVKYTYSFGPAKKTFKKYYKTEAQFLIDKVMEPYYRYMYGFEVKNDGPFIPFPSKGDNGQRDRIFVDVFPYGVIPDKTTPKAYFAEHKKQKQNDFQKIKNLCIVKKPTMPVKTQETQNDIYFTPVKKYFYYLENQNSQKENFNPQQKYEDIRRAFRDKKWGYMLSDKIIMGHIHIEDFDKLFKGENCLNLDQQRKLLKLFKNSKKRGVVVTTTVSDLRTVPKMFRTRSALGVVVVDKPLYGLEKLATKYGMHTFDNPTAEDILNNNDFYERINIQDELIDAVEESYGPESEEIEKWATNQEKIAQEHHQLVKVSDFVHNSDLSQAM